MASGGFDNPHKSPLLVDRKLTQKEIQAIVSFLEGLECKGELKEPKLPEK
jgi:hypothetical protein